MDIYTPDEFVRSLKMRGIAAKMDDARRYVKETDKPFYTEDDFEDAWRELTREPIMFAWEKREKARPGEKELEEMHAEKSSSGKYYWRKEY